MDLIEIIIVGVPIYLLFILTVYLVGYYFSLGSNKAERDHMRYMAKFLLEHNEELGIDSDD